jgi:hypothetical protein
MSRYQHGLYKSQFLPTLNWCTDLHVTFRYEFCMWILLLFHMEEYAYIRKLAEMRNPRGIWNFYVK